jgi:hypothetical protein
LFVFALLSLNRTTACSQEVAIDSTTLRQGAVYIYLDDVFYDEYIKEEITFVNYVRDRHQAQVHIKMYYESTGSRGTEFTIEFYGLREFAGINDTLTYTSYFQDTEEIIRAGIVHTIKLGLTRYVSHTPVAEFLSIQLDLPKIEEEVIDRWDFWIFYLSTGGSLNVEEKLRSYTISGSCSADRVTEQLKVSFGAYTYYREEDFEVSDGTVTSYRRNHKIDGLIVKSLGMHWSAGIGGELASSLYSNTKLYSFLAPAIEFDVYPYSEFQRRNFVFLYQIGFAHAQYEEETIYEKTEENLIRGKLSIRYMLKRRWGSVDASLTGSHYFHDFDKHRLTARFDQSINVFEGFSLNLSCTGSLIHDQLSLPRRGLSDEEILTKQRELETQYDVYFHIGFSYTFGSKYSNVVNPRFRYF